jgi:hypothetical protein
VDILEAIEMLEAVGFHMYRKILYGGIQVGAALVYTPIDLYCRLILDGDTTFVDFGSGEWDDVDELRDDLPTLLMQLVAETDASNPPPVSAPVKAFESVFRKKLAEIEKEAGRKVDFLWEGSDGYWVGIYRGAVLAINNHLRVIALDGGELSYQNNFFGYPEADARAGMTLQDAFAAIDKLGGCEEMQVEEPVGAG